MASQLAIARAAAAQCLDAALQRLPAQGTARNLKLSFLLCTQGDDAAARNQRGPHIRVEGQARLRGVQVGGRGEGRSPAVRRTAGASQRDFQSVTLALALQPTAAQFMASLAPLLRAHGSQHPPTCRRPPRLSPPTHRPWPSLPPLTVPPPPHPPHPTPPPPPLLSYSCYWHRRTGPAS